MAHLFNDFEQIIASEYSRREAQGPRHGHSRAYVRQDGRAERESKEKDTHKLIVEVAERLFRQIGFQKTTVADIARELHMSPANVYRFFAAKSEINEAVCMDLLGKIEAEGEKIAASRSTATQRIRNLIGAVEKTHHKQYKFDRKLHDLIDAAISENWAIMRRHNERMAAIWSKSSRVAWRLASFRWETRPLRHVSSTPLASGSAIRA